MKLILNESQYNRIFNNGKKKIIITESQYNRLISEAVSLPLDKIKVGNIIQITNSSKDKLRFRVISKDYNYFIMINCNNGVYKNAYFLIDKNSLDGTNITYKSVQNKNIDKNNPLESLKKSRMDTFKNITDISIYDDGQKTGCNLSDSAKKLFTLDVDSGSISEPDDKPEDGDGEKGDDKFSEKDLLDEIRGWKEGYKYNLILSDKSSVYFDVMAVGPNSINFEITDTSGESASRYDELKEFNLSFDINSKNIEIKKEDPILFDMKIKKYIGGEDEGEAKFDEIEIWDIVDFGLPIDVKPDDKPGLVLTDKEIDDYLKKFIKDSDLLQTSLYKKPNAILELLGLARERGRIPAEGKLANWGTYVDKQAKKMNFYKEFEPGTEVDGEFLKLEITDRGGVDDKVKDFSKIRTKVKSFNKSDKYVMLYTNFGKDIEVDENFKYKISIIELLEKVDGDNIYSVVLSSRETAKGSFNKVGDGKFKVKIVKD